MTTATLDRLSSGGLGLGVSGPQVIEGWHGVDYGKPLTRTRKAVAIIRAALERKQPLIYRGKTYQIPVQGGTGFGKPLKLMMLPKRSRVPIYLATIGPRNVAMATEITHRWLPIFFAPNHASVFEESLDLGLSRRS
jgi:alkanesulfonate monooxygenase SsuD/methylene tetrahydromethanopterin reductase-like flavin-dependent oxidoreductase (luciferase family)